MIGRISELLIAKDGGSGQGFVTFEEFQLGSTLHATLDMPILKRPPGDVTYSILPSEVCYSNSAHIRG